MSAEYNKKLVEDMYVALNTKDLDAHDNYWTCYNKHIFISMVWQLDTIIKF